MEDKKCKNDYSNNINLKNILKNLQWIDMIKILEVMKK